MRGIIDISKLKNPPEKHELETAKFFAELGYDIEFIPPSNIPEVHRPDIVMEGIEWEIKSPMGKSKNTIRRNIKQATKQSKNIIVDLRRILSSEQQCIQQIEERFVKHHSIKKIIVIKKDGGLIRLSR